MAALIIQIITESLVLGSLAGIIVMFVSRVVKIYQSEEVMHEEIGMMGMIAFVMLIASGYANVLTETGAINELVDATLNITGESHLSVAFFLLIVGTIITLGIGTSFGTIPILAVLYAPVMIAVGMSPLASAALIGTAARSKPGWRSWAVRASPTSCATARTCGSGPAQRSPPDAMCCRPGRRPHRRAPPQAHRLRRSDSNTTLP